MAAPKGATPFTFTILVAIGQLIALLSVTVINGREITSRPSPKYGDFAYWNRIREEEKALKKAEDQESSPQIALHLLKEHVSTDASWSFSKNYRSTGKDFKYKTEVSSTSMEEERQTCQCPCAKVDTTEERQQNFPDDGKTVTTDRKITPLLESRNIIDPGQPQCPPGYRYEKGKCRLVEP